MQHYVSKCTILWKQYDNTVYKLIRWSIYGLLFLSCFILVICYHTNCELGDVNENLLKYFFNVAMLNILLKLLYNLLCMSNTLL